MWSLNGGVTLAYLGAWAAGTYQPGQIVVDNGVEYMCVRTTTKRPTGWPGSAATTYGTSLPASPVDGQEAVLVDNLTNPTYQWRFRYNASSTSAYKWEFVGGTIARTSIANDEVIGSTGGWTWTTTTCDFLIPRSGDYIITADCLFYNGSTGGTMYLAIANASVGPSPVDNQSQVSLAASSSTTISCTSRCPNISGNQTMRLVVFATATGFHNTNRSLRVTPSRVS